MKKASTASTVLNAVQGKLVSAIVTAIKSFASARKAVLDLAGTIKTLAEYETIRPHLVTKLLEAGYEASTVKYYCFLIRQGSNGGKGFTKTNGGNKKSKSKALPTVSGMKNGTATESGKAGIAAHLDFEGEDRIMNATNAIRLVFNSLTASEVVTVLERVMKDTTNTGFTLKAIVKVDVARLNKKNAKAA